ncbi:MAG: methylated-DNA--[protein]-cysteine S-methyltransferase [Pirellulales bacterium]
MPHTVINLRQQLIQTPVGPFRACWTERGLQCFEFFRGKSASVPWTDAKDLPPEAESLESAVQAYFETGNFEFDLGLLDWSGVSDFQQRVLRKCYRIKPGTTLTYGQLAAKVGSPAAARAVGGAMARNRWPLLIPCHRVVGSNGKMTGYSGVGGIDTKVKLLDMERSV